MNSEIIIAAVGLGGNVLTALGVIITGRMSNKNAMQQIESAERVRKAERKELLRTRKRDAAAERSQAFETAVIRFVDVLTDATAWISMWCGRPVGYNEVERAAVPQEAIWRAVAVQTAANALWVVDPRNSNDTAGAEIAVTAEHLATKTRLVLGELERGINEHSWGINSGGSSDTSVRAQVLGIEAELHTFLENLHS